MARLSLTQVARPAIPSIPRFLVPAAVQTRDASVVRIRKTVKKKKALPKDYKRPNLSKRDFPQFSLCEAMRLVPLSGRLSCGRGPNAGSPRLDMEVELNGIANLEPL